MKRRQFLSTAVALAGVAAVGVSVGTASELKPKEIGKFSEDVEAFGLLTNSFQLGCKFSEELSKVCVVFGAFGAKTEKATYTKFDAGSIFLTSVDIDCNGQRFYFTFRRYDGHSFRKSIEFACKQVGIEIERCVEPSSLA